MDKDRVFTFGSRVMSTPGTGRPVFLLGDSRTGTLSIHNWLTLNGLKSLHYYIYEANQKTPLHLHLEENERNFLEFVRVSRMDAYSDYPTRAFYRQLYALFPDASFVLTTRSSTERWISSLRRFLEIFNAPVDEVGLRKSYELENGNIRELFGDGTRRFLDICIDGDNKENSANLAKFLNVPFKFLISQDNQSDEISVEILSRYHRLYSTQGDRTVEAVERMVSPFKGMLSEFGWAYLVNDTNEFLQIQFGPPVWSEDQRRTASEVIKTRVAKLGALGITYRKFIIPEKSVVYPEYLPRVFNTLVETKERPAILIAADNELSVSYLRDYLQDAKSYGQMYFRGDTHTTWHGAWFVYRFIIRKLQMAGLNISCDPFIFSDLIPSVAAYDGDLWTQIDPASKREFDSRWGFTSASFGLELAIKLALNPARKQARLVSVPVEYQSWFSGRETLVYEREDNVGLKVVIFRDSTLDFCHELLAQHFRRSVFIWHQGLIYEEVLERENPDIVLHIMAERFVTRYAGLPAVTRVMPV